MDIYFDDFNTEMQQKLLKLARIKAPEEANWDVFPITTIEFEDDDTEDEQDPFEQTEQM